MTITLSPCLESHLPAITAIYADAVLHGSASFELTPPDLAEMQRRRQAILDGGYPYLVAEDNGELLGYAYASAYRPRLAYKASVENSIYVAPKAQRRGVGRLLLDALIKDCTARGYRQMIAVIGDSANAGSIGLHAAAGFVMVGTMKNVGFKHGRWLDSVDMQLPLGEAETTPSPFAV